MCVRISFSISFSLIAKSIYYYARCSNICGPPGGLNRSRSEHPSRGTSPEWKDYYQSLRQRGGHLDVVLWVLHGHSAGHCQCEGPGLIGRDIHRSVIHLTYDPPPPPLTHTTGPDSKFRFWKLTI